MKVFDSYRWAVLHWETLGKWNAFVTQKTKSSQCVHIEGVAVVVEGFGRTVTILLEVRVELLLSFCFVPHTLPLFFLLKKRKMRGKIIKNDVTIVVEFLFDFRSSTLKYNVRWTKPPASSALREILLRM